MDLERLKAMDNIIQEWIKVNKRLVATPDMVISGLVQAGLFSDDENSLKIFIDEVKKMTKKEQREFLNVHRIGVKEIRFKNRDNY